MSPTWSAPRCILHLDMDAFFAAVEVREDPTLAGKPLLIGHPGPRGVVATASYEARVWGCHSAQPTAVALRLCPHAIVRKGRMDLYRQVSDQMFAILDDFSPLVQPLSIDEAFIDLTGSERLLGDPTDVARRLKDRIKSELRVTASVGVAPNKFLAKLASDLNKPDGLTVIRPEDVDTLLPPMPITKLWGIGKVTAERLNRRGIRTIGDLRTKPESWLRGVLGSDAERYFRLARGLDDRPVVPDSQAKSVGHEKTFGEDQLDPAAVRSVLLDHVELVGMRLRRHGLTARGVSLKIRFGDFQTINRSATLPAATDATGDLWQAAVAIFDRWPFQPVRLIGVTAERLEPKAAAQLGLFTDVNHERQQRLDAVADRINGRFGKRTIRRAAAVPKPKPPQ